LAEKGGDAVREGYIAVVVLAEDMGVAYSTVWRWLKRSGVVPVKFAGDRRVYITDEEAARLREPRPTENRRPDDSETAV